MSVHLTKRQMRRLAAAEGVVLSATQTNRPGRRRDITRLVTTAAVPGTPPPTVGRAWQGVILQPAADLHGSDLAGTHLTTADLVGAHLTGATLLSANLTRTDGRVCKPGSVGKCR